MNVFSQTATAPTAGDGTSGNPYQIATLNNLYWIASNTVNWDKHYIQTADIDASETENWFNGLGWSPIGNGSVNFTGTYNGSGYRIIGLSISRPDQDYVGLFGCIYATPVFKSTINLKNIILTGGSIRGKDYTGFLTGLNNYGVLINCHSTGTVSGNDRVGGLIGQNSGPVTKCSASGNVSGHYGIGGFVGRMEYEYIRECYAAGKVTGNRYAGGFIGYLYSYTISNCYSKGSVVRSGSLDIDFGGFVGRNYGGAIRNCYSKGAVYESSGIIWSSKDKGFCGSISSSYMTANYWDTETSGQTTTAGVATGAATDQMRSSSTFINAGWDFSGETTNGTNDYWEIDISGLINDGYPYITGSLTKEPEYGNGSQSDPYHIANFANLYWIAENSSRWSYHYIQTADIDASSTLSLNAGAGWSPIGNYDNSFTGSYDGQGHSISSLFINRSTGVYVGLFGRTSGSKISNLHLTGVNITGKDHVGGLAGYNYNISTIEKCSATGSVTGSTNTGGLVGSNWNSSSVTLSWSDCAVSGSRHTGGLVGYSYNSSSIDNCYSRSDVISASYYGGGLIGQNLTSSVANSYSTGTVTGDLANIGGFIGYNNSTVSNCFWDTETSGQILSSGGTGKTTAEMKTLSTFTNAGWDFIGETANGTNDHWNIGSFSNDGYPYLINNLMIPDGTGTMQDPVRIVTLDHLKWVSDNPSSWSYYFVQETDIDAYDTRYWNGGMGWSPIGNSMIKFTGTYNGQNHIIEGLFINRPSTNYVGLFGYTTGATIINFGISESDYIGNAYLGGMIGYSVSTSINYCFTSGYLKGSTNDYIGGLVGYSYTGSTINNSYSCCNVEGDSYIGGLIGWNNSNTSVSNCYSVGKVTANHNPGGLIGHNWGSVTLSYWDKETSGQTYSSGGTGKTTALMMTESTFSTAGWNFTNVWKMEDGYPRFKWQTYYPGPLVHTINATVISAGSATITSAVNGIGNIGITQSGVCWNTTGDPTISDSKTEDGSVLAVGQYNSEMTGLTRNTNYYVKAYATNSKGTYYGNQIIFQTLPYQSVQPLGSGTEPDPYRIANLENLYWLAENSTRWGFDYIQTADIDVSETSTWNNGAGWLPIGNETIKFTGKYNGQNFKITGLYINRSTSSYIGLFGYINSSVIKNVVIIESNIIGDDGVGILTGCCTNSTIENCVAGGAVRGSTWIGGLAGDAGSSIINKCYNFSNISGRGYTGGITGEGSYSTISNCFNSGSVTGALGGYYAGGISGMNDSYSTITDCYNTGAIESQGESVGGLVGRNNWYSVINNSYSIGKVTGSILLDIGGLIGSNYDVATVVDCYWDIYISGINLSAGGIGLTTQEMKDKSIMIAAGWDYAGETANGTDDVWNTHPFFNNGYPFLTYQDGVPPGDGSTGNPYQVTSFNNLLAVSGNYSSWVYNYIQTSDIDASETVSLNAGAGWSPIGNYNHVFTGSYNGQNKTVSGLYIFSTTADYIGFFGKTSGASISNLNLTDVNVTADTHVGGLAGYNIGTAVEKCSVTGSVTGITNTGGLVGASWNSSSVSRSWSDCAVTGSRHTGGLVGYSYNSSSIDNCYSRSNVISASYFGGGLVGQNFSASVSNSYSTGTISGELANIGGFIGYNNSTVSNCFWDTETSGLTKTSGGTGITTAEMKAIATFTNAGWDFAGETANGTNDYWSFGSLNNDGYPYLSWQVFVFEGPQNLEGSFSGSDFTLSWNEVSGASSYSVYSTDDPYVPFPSEWTEEVSVVTGTNWTDVSVTAGKKFYVVVAVTGK